MTTKRDATGAELALEPVQALEEMARGGLGVTPKTRDRAAAEIRDRRARLNVGELEIRELRTLVDAPIGEVAETTRELARAELVNRELLGETSGKTEA